MSQYLLSVCHEEEYGDLDLDDPEMKRMFERVSAFNEELQAAGAWVSAGGLQTASSATVVRAADGGVSMTDGPFAETKEQMGGFYVIDVDDFDTALDWAGKATVACGAPIEVRPFQ